MTNYKMLHKYKHEYCFVNEKMIILDEVITELLKKIESDYVYFDLINSLIDSVDDEGHKIFSHEFSKLVERI